VENIDALELGLHFFHLPALRFERDRVAQYRPLSTVTIQDY